jgi:hypothetical protein
MRRLLYLPALLLLMMSLTACGSPKLTLENVPVPPEASREPFEGGFEVRLDLNVEEIQTTLREKFGAADVDILMLPDTATWENVLSFYQPLLGKEGWKVETELSRSYRHYELMVWSRGQQALAVAYMPEDEELPNNFLALVLTR